MDETYVIQFTGTSEVFLSAIKVNCEIFVMTGGQLMVLKWYDNFYLCAWELTPWSIKGQLKAHKHNKYKTQLQKELIASKKTKQNNA